MGFNSKKKVLEGCNPLGRGANEAFKAVLKHLALEEGHKKRVKQKMNLGDLDIS